jgi:cytochrome oxidase Cu insertion factor (SCO1/SenC/PrrC family)
MKNNCYTHFEMEPVMRLTIWIVAVLSFAFSDPASAQRRKVSDEEFVQQAPAVGDPLPDVTVYDSQGNEVDTSSLRGHYTVLTFGCLT